MSEFKSFLKILVGVLIVAVTLLLAVHLGMKLEASLGDAGKSLSSWVQAVGSIAAILGAVYVTRMQMDHAVRREEEARARDRKDKLDGTIEIARKLHLACGRTQRAVRKHIENGTDYRSAVRGFKALSRGGRKALQDVPLHMPPYSSVAREVIVIRRALYLYERRISKLLLEGASVTLTLRKAETIFSRMSTEVERLADRSSRVIGSS